MEASGGIRGQKRVNLPLAEGQEVIDLTVGVLAARCSGTFGRGFRLRSVGRRLYVQLTGRRVPLYLDFDADPVDVQERALALLRFRHDHKGGFDSDAWHEACFGEGVRTGKRPGRKGKDEKRRLDANEVAAIWQRFKRAQGVSDATIERHYFSHLRRLDPEQPLSDGSLLRAIEQTSPRSPSRRRAVAFLRQLCELCGQPWNGALLDPLQNAGRAMEHRPQAFFSDEEIRAILGGGLGGSWQRVVVLLAVYGLRPWEAWIAEPSRERPDCAWVPAGKTNRHGTTPPRQVPPFHPEWVDEFRLPQLWAKPLPSLSSKSQAGARVNQHLRRHGLIDGEGQTSYGFRHAYARRLHSPWYRVTDAHAALFMGHTVAAHHKAYRSWLGGEDPIGIYLGSPG
jgi:integrase